MNKSEAKQWLMRHNFQEAMRVAVADLLNNQNYEPFLKLATDGQTTIGVKINSANNISFYSAEPFIEELPIVYEAPIEGPSIEPEEPTVAPEPEPAPEQKPAPKPKRTRKVRALESS